MYNKMVLISGDFYNHLTNDVDVVIGGPPCQGLTQNKKKMKLYHLQRSIFLKISSKKIYGYLPTAGEMKWPVLELYFGGLGYGR